METKKSQVSRVLISYCLDDKERVLHLAKKLRDSGIDIHLDQDEYLVNNTIPSLRDWMLKQMRLADYIIVVPTKDYSAKVTAAEKSALVSVNRTDSYLLNNEIEDSGCVSKKFISTLLDKSDFQYIPSLLQKNPSFQLNDYSNDDLKDLLSHLKNLQSFLFFIDSNNNSNIESKSSSFDEEILKRFASRRKLCYEIEDEGDDIQPIIPPDIPTKQCHRCKKMISEITFRSHSACHSTEILPFLFLGGDINAKNKIELKKRTNITHIINAAWECANYYPDDFVYKNYHLIDSPTEDIYKILDDAVNFIENASENNGIVLVHCVQGVSRSSSIVIAFLMKHNHWRFKRALEFTKQLRPVIDPNIGFISQLEDFEKRIFGETQSTVSAPLHSLPSSRGTSSCCLL